MSNSRIEFKIKKDSLNNDVELDSMSVEAAEAFTILIDSVTRIVQLTANNKNIKISILKGSACVLAQGEVVESICSNFKEVINNNSTNKDLVEQWRRVQNLFTKNGLSYEANIVTKNENVELVPILKSANKLRAKPRQSIRLESTISFIVGTLIAVGGKDPNIHVETEDGERLTISCTEQDAKRAKSFLYSTILLSAWAKSNGAFEFCDIYHPTQHELFRDFHEFIHSFNKADEISSLKSLHYKCREFLISKSYIELVKFLRLFTHETTDVNVLNTILIVTQDFKNHDTLKMKIGQIRDLLDKKLRTQKTH